MRFTNIMSLLQTRAAAKGASPNLQEANAEITGEV